ncbi:MAG: PAS domain S-box protein [Opitutales bacterium]|nr:PAS domain S-box protein [Opitutales bacterium]
MIPEEEENALLLRVAAKIGKFGAWSVSLPDGKHRWTEEARQIHGVPAGERPDLGELIRFYIPEHRALIQSAFEACAQEGTPFDLTLALDNRAGERVWVRCTGEAVRDASGRIVQARGGVQDVTSQVEASKRLRDSESRNLALFENRHIAMLLVDPGDGSIIDANPAAESFYGWTRDELRTKRIEEINTLSPARTRGEIEDALRLKRTDFQHRHRLANGDIRDVEVLSAPIEHGERPLLYSIIRDLTQRKLAEAKIRLFARMVETIPHPMAYINCEYRYEVVNPAYASCFGAVPEDMVGKTIPDFFGADVFESEIKPRADRALSGEDVRFEAAFQFPAYGLRWTLRSYFPYTDETGSVIGVFSHSIDITEEKTLAKTLLRSQRLESIGALAGGVAHDLNNILSPIVMASDLLELDLTDKRPRELISTIRNSARRGSEMVKQILTFARGADGQTSIIDFNLILKEIRRLVAETFPKEIHYTFFDCPHPWSVEGDATQLHQVLLNLCVNARDAMPMGGRLNVGIENFRLTEGDAAPVRGMAPGTYVRMFVADDGEGIAPGDLDRIFDPFFSTKPPGAGTGLGLATSRDIIKKHGGSITVQSEPGNGAIFQIFLPAEPRERADAAPEPAGPVVPGNEKRILVVDDEASIRSIIKQVLEAHDYTPVTAANGAEALVFLAEDPGGFSAALVDAHMPVMGGVPTIRAIRAIRRDLPVILVSGDTQLVTPENVKAIGATGSLSKPFTTQNMLHALEQVLPVAH